MNTPLSLSQFIARLPKAELHMHLEGALEPELLFKFAERNNIQLPYKTVDEVSHNYNFTNLGSFLTLFQQATLTLCTEEDFYELMMHYLKKASSQNVLHTEVFFELQSYQARGINLDSIMRGLIRACHDGKKLYNISSFLILCILRDLPEENALALLPFIKEYKNDIIAVGLASHEQNNPPERFVNFFNEIRKLGLAVVAHAGEEAGPDYIWQALRLLHAERIDHGTRALEDNHLVDYLLKHQTPITACPLSNLKLKVVTSLSKHPLQKMLARGLNVSINSDDPIYFGGYINENYQAITTALNLSRQDLVTCARNSFKGSFLPEKQKQEFLVIVSAYAAENR